MPSPKVSIIVPIYNSEKYIHQCIRSLLSQTLKDIEIILIDDGSSDQSGFICDFYHHTDKRIHVLHKQNSGYGDSVNRGIQLAHGDYIGIIESDDFIEPDMYEKLYKEASRNKTDITKCYFYLFNQYAKNQRKEYHYVSDFIQEPTSPFNVRDYPEILTYHSSIWAAIYKSSFIKKIKLQKTPRASYQDFPFVFEALLKANRISIVPEYLLYYRHEKEQLSSTIAPGKEVLFLLDHANYLINFMKKENLLDRYENEFFYHVTKCLHGYFITTSSEIKKQFYEELITFYRPFQGLFSFKYFDDHLKKFVYALWQEDKEFLFQINAPVSLYKKMLVKTLSSFIINKAKRKAFRKKLLKHM